MKIQLVDRNELLVHHWNELFDGIPDVEVFHSDFFTPKTDCVVSPANSYGFMDGGLDAAITKRLGPQVQRRVQDKIKGEYGGELLVGQALLVETDDKEIPYCISAPTMRVPMIISDTPNVYLASKAIFRLLKRAIIAKIPIEKVTISGLGTGVGKVSFETCAIQMRVAYNDFWEDKYRFPVTWKDAQARHQLLFRQQAKDIQFEK